jgi:HD-GYP domain-containing protein (c-di-GMP phosphodiesterase class II)
MVRRKNVLGKNDINVVNYKEFLDLLINLLNLIQEKRDPYVKNHSQNVSKLSIEIANQLNSKLEKNLILNS